MKDAAPFRRLFGVAALRVVLVHPAESATSATVSSPSAAGDKEFATCCLRRCSAAASAARASASSRSRCLTTSARAHRHRVSSSFFRPWLKRNSLLMHVVRGSSNCASKLSMTASNDSALEPPNTRTKGPVRVPKPRAAECSAAASAAAEADKS
eukprot:6190933-Pleurochrysis_carterae.AAC.3